jgi:hypothetical protein
MDPELHRDARKESKCYVPNRPLRRRGGAVAVEEAGEEVTGGDEAVRFKGEDNRTVVVTVETWFIPNF